MGCGCVSQQKTGRPTGPRLFLATSDAEFLRTLGADELKDKKRLLAYYHMLNEGQFEVTDAFRQQVRQKGVPDRYRWQAWRALSGWSSLYKPGVYEKLVQGEPDRRVADAVAKDLDRTFPKLDEFDEEKKRHLGSLVRAYARLVPQVGYCQGMNFIAGFLLLACRNSHHEDAFFMFVQMMIKYRASLLFCDGLPLLKLLTFQFRMLLPVFNPEVAAHFTQESITPELYITKWMLTIFTQPLNFDSAARVWDLIVCDGIEVLVLLCLANIKLLQARLLLQDTEGILELLSLHKDTAPPTGGEIVQTALNLKLPKRGADGLEASMRTFRDQWAQECADEAAELKRAELAFCGSIDVRKLVEEATARQPPPDVSDTVAAPQMQIGSPAVASPVTLPSRCFAAGSGAEQSSPSSSAEADSHRAATSPVDGTASPYIVAAETKVDIVNISGITRWPTADCITKVSEDSPQRHKRADSEPSPHHQKSSEQTRQMSLRPELHLCLTPRPLAGTEPTDPASGQEDFEGDSRSTSCELPSVGVADEAPPAPAASPSSARGPLASAPTPTKNRRQQEGTSSPHSTATAPAAIGEHWPSSDFGSSLPALETSHASTLPPLFLGSSLQQQAQGEVPGTESPKDSNVDEGPSRTPKASLWTSPASCRQSPTGNSEVSDARMAI